MKTQVRLAKFLLVITLCAATALATPQQLDRTKIPSPGKTPELHVPTWTKATLNNGALLIVSERHDLPLVSFSISFLGGANQFEPAGKRGLATMTSAMLNEGTTTKTGDQLSDALQLLGTNIGANIGGEEGSISFTSTKAKFDATLAILADVMLNPAFPPQALERLRSRMLVGLTRAKDQPNSIGTAVFAKVLFGDAHPYGQRTTEASVKAITRDDVVAFHKAYYQPGRAIITVTGDVNAATTKGAIEKSLAAWPKAGEKPAFNYPKPPALRPTTIYLVDKPGSAQSIFNIGLPGPARNTPDYFALQVLNHILGGQFQSQEGQAIPRSLLRLLFLFLYSYSAACCGVVDSRLNYNIREVHGYSYGVNSSFAYGRGPGAFRTGGAIVSAKTDAALIEFMKELRGIVGERPITDEELQTSKDALIQGLPRRFGSVAAIGGAITDLTVQGLPDDYYQGYAKAVAAVTKENLLRVAKKYLDLDHLAIVIVGDRASIEEPLKATKIAPITILDVDGNAPLGGGGSGNKRSAPTR